MGNVGAKDLSIVILAAGQGTRMKSALPKVLHPIGGKPMLAHVLETAKSLSPTQIIVVYGYGGQVLKTALDEPSVKWVEQPKQQGTGDAVAKALPLIPAHHRVLILYGDVPLIRAQTLSELLKETPYSSLGLLTIQTDFPTGLGRIVRVDGEVERCVEEKDASLEEKKITEVNTGIFVASSEKLKIWMGKLTNHNAQKEYYLTDVIHFAALDAVPIVTGTPTYPHEVLGVNDRAQQAIVERHYQRMQAEALLSLGVWIADPLRFDLRGALAAENDVMIDVNVLFQGENVLKKGTQIGPNCILINCEIGENVIILANSYLENVRVGDHAIIGPFARLRPGTVLEESVHIGNFVEIKNATVGMGTKINHLSYMGDAHIGANVNVGAGTITCNYDGANKYQTIIEDDVHIGSDTQLIAPVRIGKGATLGAGSTLSQNAPANQLTLTHRLCQRSQDWERPTKNKDE